MGEIVLPIIRMSSTHTGSLTMEPITCPLMIHKRVDWLGRALALHRDDLNLSRVGFSMPEYEEEINVEAYVPSDALEYMEEIISDIKGYMWYPAGPQPVCGLSSPTEAFLVDAARMPFIFWNANKKYIRQRATKWLDGYARDMVLEDYPKPNAENMLMIVPPEFTIRNYKDLVKRPRVGR